jgi:hypothetical protein
VVLMRLRDAIPKFCSSGDNFGEPASFQALADLSEAGTGIQASPADRSRFPPKSLYCKR